jgi:hypothetical protein
MSALGQKPTSRASSGMSALPSKRTFISIALFGDWHGLGRQLQNRLGRRARLRSEAQFGRLLPDSALTRLIAELGDVDARRVLMLNRDLQGCEVLIRQCHRRSKQHRREINHGRKWRGRKGLTSNARQENTAGIRPRAIRRALIFCVMALLSFLEKQCFSYRDEDRHVQH